MKRIKLNVMIELLLLAFFSLWIAGCAKRNIIAETSQPLVEITDSREGVTPNESSEASLEVEFEKIYFDFDKYELTPEATKRLKRNAGIMKLMPKKTLFFVEGHCDCRGSYEYNDMLGMKRAQTITAYYRNSGVDQDIVVVSCGENHLISNIHWLNRRGLTGIANMP